jgi:predicted component of type VI protein secretion system
LRIVIKGVTSNELPDFLPEGKSRKLIDELLCGYFIPIDVPYTIKIDVTNDGTGMEVGEVTLGFNTVLT